MHGAGTETRTRWLGISEDEKANEGPTSGPSLRRSFKNDPCSLELLFVLFLSRRGGLLLRLLRRLIGWGRCGIGRSVIFGLGRRVGLRCIRLRGRGVVGLCLVRLGR